MKIRLKISPKLTKDQLIQRLPAMAKAIAEAILEKGMGVGASIEGQNKRHPVGAIASAEDDIYGQGSEALAGVYSWLLKRLSVEIKKGGDLSEDDFRHEMQEKFGINLGGQTDHKHATEIAKILSMFPSDIMEDRVKTISVDGRFGASKRKYPNHGRYYDDGKRIVLNPNIFGEDTKYTTDDGDNIEKLTHTLVHEIGHSVDDQNGLSDKKEWREISGWKYIGDAEPKEGFDRMILKEEGAPTLKGKWEYRKGTNFPRWYGARNPKEDFCESFAFAFLGATHYFKGETGKAKLDFMKKVIGDIRKSGLPGIGLTNESHDDLAKSQEFVSYASRRSETINGDDFDPFEKAVREFTFEACDTLYFEKAEGGEEAPKDTPAPKAAPASPAGAPAAGGAGGENPQKGQQKPGHKYIKRETLPNGKYRYWYEMPTGEMYFSDGKPLHDEASHKEEIPATADFQNYKAGKGAHQMMSEPPPGVEPHFFNKVEAPKLVNDIKPHALSNEPGATPEEKDAAQAEVERAQKPKREKIDFAFKADHIDKIVSALKTWAISGVDKSFGKQGVQLSFRVHIENDGDGLCKPEAGQKKFEAEGGYRHDIREDSTVYREALAFNIDNTLGWNLVPPVVNRTLKGMGMRHVLEAIKEKVGEKSPEYKALASKSLASCSLMHFSKGAHRVGDDAGRELIPDVSDEDLMHGMLFDMIINHQDRHDLNLMLSPKAEGDGSQLLCIDNGYAFGNGANRISCLTGARCSPIKDLKTQFIDQKTLRDLRKLRTDLNNKMRRRKIVTDEMRKHIPWDQIQRISHRIDFILDYNKRGPKGRVVMPDSSAMEAWEVKKYPPKFNKRDLKNKLESAFDITGKTNLVDYHKAVPNPADAPKIPQFSGASAVKDFLHPLKGILSESQNRHLTNIVEAYSGKGQRRDDSLYIAVSSAVKLLPKKLVNQLMINQRFGERLGLSDEYAEGLKGDALAAVNRDYQGEFQSALKRNGGEAALLKHAHGEMTEAEAIKLVGDETFRKAQGRWAVHPKLRMIPENKTEAIFEDPNQFGWDTKPKEVAPVEGKKKIWEREPGDRGTAQHPWPKPETKSGGGTEEKVEAKVEERAKKVREGWDKRLNPDVERSQGEPDLFVRLEK